ncbi:MAG: type III pantothenate kinase [Sterolibacterium sp.]|nr:type III pantothenate kinase [Sterolibacterium sp.]
MSDSLWLCLDCGNTRLKWGTYDPARQCWLAQGALLLTEIGRLPAEVRASPGYSTPLGVVGCIVANHEARAAIELGADALGAPLRWNESQAAQCGVTNGYDEPGQLGADRWAALIGARHLQPQAPCLVVTAGTATTIDRLDADGCFQGGLILPGVDLMRTALAHHTARLPLAKGDFQTLPRNTRAAIASGCLQATSGAIERMFRPIADEPAAICLLSGGAAGHFVNLLDIPLRHVENLVLEGLARVAVADLAD